MMTFVCSYVEIWHGKHAYKVLDILDQVYGYVGEIAHFFLLRIILTMNLTLLNNGTNCFMMTPCLRWQLRTSLCTCDEVSFDSCELPSAACDALDKLSVCD